MSTDALPPGLFRALPAASLLLRIRASFLVMILMLAGAPVASAWQAPGAMEPRAEESSVREPRGPEQTPSAPAPVLAHAEPDPAHQVVDPSLYAGLRYRSVGPYRGGRITAVDGVPGRPFTFFFGASGGGVWRTDNAGHTWRNVTDGHLPVGSIGAVEVADADPNVIYVGTGSACIRGNVSTGVGVFRSTDMGATWEFVGLPDAGQIGRIVTHPDDPDRLWVAVLGHAFGPSEQRGVYRSTDGGASWERVLFVSAETGAVDVAMNPANPRVLYAAMWTAERKPWTVTSGSEESGLFKSVDGGDTWARVEGGFPQGLVGRIGVTVSPANPHRVWAIVEADADRSAVYRSDDGGATWQRLSGQGGLVSRPWYYMHIEAHPTDENSVFVLNGGFYRSVDGGEEFDRIAMPHGDQHDMWIDPANPDVLFVGNDGGATISLDDGATWTHQLNQPTAEFYSVTVDDDFPYRIYGPQQDNSTISVPSMATYSGISLQHWRAVGGCETGPIAIKPDEPEVIYSGCFGGRLARFDRRTEQFRQIRDYPENMAGMPESALRYRIQWNAPITTSRHDPDVLYHGSQFVHRSTNQGQSWEVISPDLTRQEAEVFGQAGGPITHDVTGVEIYSALLAIEEDVHDPAVLWAGSNDGVVSISRDGGATWSDVTPADMPRLTTVNRIEPSPHRAGKAYVTAYRYRMDDWAPYVYRTEDFGASWERIADGTRGIPPGWTTRVVREDPAREGLLYAGTEFGLLVSFDDGGHWQTLQQNLPRTPVTDLRVHRDDLVVATQGRSFWVLDDLTPLHQMTDEAAAAATWLFAPRPAYRTSAETGQDDYDRDRVYGAMLPRAWLGENPPDGAILHYLGGGEVNEALRLEILDADGEPLRTFSSDAEGTERLPAGGGMHRFVWDLTVADPGGSPGPRAVPGSYTVRMSRGGWSQERQLELRKDPRLTSITVADLQAQFDFLMRVQREQQRLEEAVRTIRDVRQQAHGVTERVGDRPGADVLAQVVDELLADLDAIEAELVPTGGGGWGEEPRLAGHLSWVATAASSQRGVRTDARPTDQLVQRLDDLVAELDAQLGELDVVLEERVGVLNARLAEMGLAGVILPAGTP